MVVVKVERARARVAAGALVVASGHHLHSQRAKRKKRVRNSQYRAPRNMEVVVILSTELVSALAVWGLEQQHLAARVKAKG